MIQSCRDYFLSRMLPTTSEIERELWLRTNDTASEFLEIMKDYGKEIIEECINSLPNWEEVSDNIIEEVNELLEESKIDELTYSQEIKIENIVDELGNQTEKDFKEMLYQI